MKTIKLLTGILYALGLFSIAIGGYHSYKSLNLTGYVVLGDLSYELRNALGVSFFIAGLLLLIVSRGIQNSNSKI